MVNKKKQPSRITRVPKPYGDGTLTSNAFFSMIRSALRAKSRFFPSISKCRERAKIPYTGANKKRKWLYKCEGCQSLVTDKECVVHHVNECGSLRSFEELPQFVKNLFCNSDGLMLLCNKCHGEIHQKNIK